LTIGREVGATRSDSRALMQISVGFDPSVAQQVLDLFQREPGAVNVGGRLLLEVVNSEILQTELL
jgi:hypothetical protein